MSDLPGRPELRAGLSLLQERGLGLWALLATADCLDIAPGLEGRETAFPCLLLVGSAGGQLWSSLVGRGELSRAHPVDTHCREALEDFGDVLEREEGISSSLAWPAGPHEHLPVSRLGELCGWSARSRMGLGIHPDHGLWFAYRGVVLLDIEPPRDSPVPVDAACLACEDSPCVSQCPAEAVGGSQGLDLRKCFDERERAEALCGDRCLARLACPAGAASRYSLAQIAHHHAHVRMPKGWREALPEAPDEWQE